MKIKTRYHIGDKVVIYANRKIKEVCPFCEGKRYKIIDNKKFYCQNCDDGEISAESHIIEETTVKIIGINYYTLAIEEANIEDEDDKKYFSKVTEREAILIEYIVKGLNDDFYLKESYKESKIIRKIYTKKPKVKIIEIPENPENVEIQDVQNDI